VTIKIPVKRAGKAKIPLNKFYYDGEVERETKRTEDDVEYLDDILKKYRNLVTRRSEPASTATRDRSLKAGRSDRTSASYSTLQVRRWLKSDLPKKTYLYIVYIAQILRILTMYVLLLILQTFMFYFTLLGSAVSYRLFHCFKESFNFISVLILRIT